MHWSTIVQALRQRVRDDSGQDLMEYGVLMLLIAVAAIFTVSSFGDLVRDIFWGYINANNIGPDF